LKKKYQNREISWLSFNERVLQEAEDPSVPLIERIKFLGIYSNNQDEFFRVRVAALKKLSQLEETTSSMLGESPTKALNEVKAMVRKLKDRFDATYQNLRSLLEKEGIFIIDEKQLSSSQSQFARQYFIDEVRPRLFPVMLDETKKFPDLDDLSIYLAIRLVKKVDDKKEARYSIIKIPTDTLSRFLILPNKKDKKHIILLDDVIRHNLDDIYQIFDFDYAEAYTIKVTRESELSLDNDLSESLLKALERGLKKRAKGEPTRLVFDREMPEGFKNFMIKKMKLKKRDTIISGARYHNFKDFINFPSLNRKDLQYRPIKPLRHPAFIKAKSLIEVINQKDVLISVPYQSFHHLLDLLREAAIDPNVTHIKMTFYRAAKNSSVAAALINAAKNGKKVTAVVEPMARFDEQSNIRLSNLLKDQGVNVIYGVRGVKIHSKIILIERKIKGQKQKNLVACVSTGNFNESTSRIYADHILMTANQDITKELQKLFNFFANHIVINQFDTLMIAPFNYRKRINKLIKKEINNALEGKEAMILLKANNLNDPKLIKKLYKASKAGVQIKILARSICTIVPEEEFSKNIQARGLIDRYLEHARVFMFHNNGKPKVFMGSGDLMVRNFDYRIEVICPILDPKIKRVLIDILNIQWSDNVKNRIWDAKLQNKYYREIEEDAKTINTKKKQDADKANASNKAKQETSKGADKDKQANNETKVIHTKKKQEPSKAIRSQMKIYQYLKASTPKAPK